MPGLLLVAVLTVAGFALAMLVARAAFRAGVPLPEASHRYHAIDGLRGFMALSVIASHYMIWVHVMDRRLLAAGVLRLFETNLGKGPVTIFFMITAFLFYPRVRDGLFATSWRYTFVTRVFRLYPLYIVALAASVALLWAMSGFTLDPRLWADAVRTLPRWLVFWDRPDLFGVMKSSDLTLHPAWSLYWEWLFYLGLLPVTAALMSLRPARVPHWVVPAGFLVLAFVARAASHQAQTSATYLTHFASGMLVWEACRSARFTALMRTPAAGAAALLLAVAALIAMPAGMFAFVLYAPLFACFASGHTIGGLLSRPEALVLGEASYGIYLLHPLVISSLFLGVLPYGPSRYTMVLLLPVVMAAVSAVAMVTFALIERPMIDRGHAIASRYRRRAAVPKRNVEASAVRVQVDGARGSTRVS